MNDQTQTAIVTIVTTILANWVVVAPILKHAITMAWKKAFEWHDLQNDMITMKEKIAKLEKDVTASHIKIRSIESETQKTS